MADWTPFSDSRPDTADDGVDGEEESDELHGAENADRDVMLFLIDCSKAMFEPNPDGLLPFHNAIKLASMAFQTMALLP